jgi:hypothetical protein
VYLVHQSAGWVYYGAVALAKVGKNSRTLKILSELCLPIYFRSLLLTTLFENGNITINSKRACGS